MFKKFCKLFSFPSPVDLGWSNTNALSMREFGSETDGYTWEDWDNEMQKRYPVRYFLTHTLVSWFSVHVAMPLKKNWHWFVSHVVPSRRFHMLDLRQSSGYRYGWADVPEKMLYAIFNLLGEYLNDEEPHDLTKWYSREEIESDAALKTQQDALEEAQTIHYWWTVERKQEQQAISTLVNDWYISHRSENVQERELSNQTFEALKQAEAKLEEKTDEMVARLMKIRRTLWT